VNISTSVKGDTSSKISGIKCMDKLFDLRIIRIVKMNFKILENHVAARERIASTSMRKSKKDTGWRVVVVSMRRTIDIEDSKVGTEEFKSDR